MARLFRSPISFTLGSRIELLLIFCLCASFIATTIWAIFFVPMTADEANIYHVLACIDHPLSHFNTFVNSCDHRSDLHTLFGITIVKPYVYGGMLPSILYAPFYFLFHTPSAQYWFGLTFLLAFGYLLSRETAKPALSLAAILSFLPFVFQFVHDMGPIKFEFLVFPMSAIVFKKLLSSEGHARLICVLILALLVFMATEDKAFFLYLLPSLAFYCLGFAADKDYSQFAARLTKNYAPLLFTVLLSVAGISVLMFATNSEGQYYFTSLIDYINTTQQNTMPLEARGRSVAQTLQYFFVFLLLWPYYAHRVYDVLGTYYNPWSDGPVINNALNGLTAAFFALCIYLGMRNKSFSQRLSPRTAFLLLSFLSTVLVFLTIRNVWAGHHFIFLWLALAALFLDFICALDAGPLTVVLGTFLALNILSLMALSQAALLPENLPDRDAILDYFNSPERSSQALVNYSTWGLYNIHALYGPKDELVTYTDQLTPKSAQELLKLSEETGRHIYDVCVDAGWDKQGKGSMIFACSAESLADFFGGEISFQQHLSELPVWRVYEGIPK